MGDIALVKKSDPTPIGKDSEFQYLFTVSNKTSDFATNLVLTDDLPAEIEYLGSITPHVGQVDYDASKHVFKWMIPRLEGDQVLELKIRVRALTEATITNTATVSSLETDADLSNNNSTDVKDIIPIQIPNSFSPNGDGKNDFFEIPGLQLFPENEMVIMNRWGSHIYEKKGYLNQWEGEGLSEGTYFYVLKVKGSSGKWQVYKGYITLLR